MPDQDKQAITGPKNNYGRVFIEMLADPSISAFAKLCYAVMTSFGGDKTTWASVPTIAARMSVSENTVRKAQKELEENIWMIRGEEIPGMTIHWKMLAPFERTPSYLEGVREVRALKGSPSNGEGEGLIPGGGVVQGMNPKQELNHESNQEFKGEGEKPQTQPPPRNEKKPEKMVEVLENSKIGKSFQMIYEKEIKLPYIFDQKDRDAFRTFYKLGLSERQEQAAIMAFFSPDSWHRKKVIVRFWNFARVAQEYALKSSPAEEATAQERARYYEPWDPRHPSYKPDDAVKMQQLKNYEATHGKWVPKPDWAPGATGR